MALAQSYAKNMGLYGEFLCQKYFLYFSKSTICTLVKVLFCTLVKVLFFTLVKVIFVPG